MCLSCHKVYFTFYTDWIHSEERDNVQSECHCDNFVAALSQIKVVISLNILFLSGHLGHKKMAMMVKDALLSDSSSINFVLLRNHIVGANLKPDRCSCHCECCFVPLSFHLVDSLWQSSCWAPAEQHKRWAPHERAMMDEEVLMYCFLASRLSPAPEQPQGTRKQDALINLCEAGELESDCFTLISH